ncbi:MAG: acyl-CoA dehydrogenase family protein [Myxococcota bacterium]|nr:acyl-CoA dehydrogenase family protein [Myxococcota bacterium]
MDLTLSEEQTAVRDLARKILEDLATNDRLKDLEARHELIDRELWQELATANLLGVAVDEKHGGMGLGFFTLCVLLEEVGRAVAPVPVLASLALGALPLQRFGSESQQERWLPPVVRGEAIVTAALVEEGSDDPTRPTLQARRDGEGYVLSGTKILVPASQLADAILVPARTAEGKVEVFLVEASAPGLTVQAQQTTDRQPHARLTLEGVRVGPEAVLGEAGRGGEVVGWLAERATTAVCAQQLGVSDRALRMTADYARERVQFDRPIGSFQAVHQRAADAFMHVEAMRLTTWDAAWRLDEELPASEPVEIAKYWTAEGGHFVGFATQHLHGGIGIDVDYPMHRYYLWAKQSELALGSAPIQLERLGDRLAAGGTPAG